MHPYTLYCPCTECLRHVTQERIPVSKPLIDQLADRFLACPLPETVKVDPCAMPEKVPYFFERTGTNLLSATEARQVLEHVLGDALELERERIIALLLDDKRVQVWIPEAGDLYPVTANDLRKLFQA